MTDGLGKSVCPLCGKAAVTKYRPFCSRRCGDLDLYGWLGGHYRVQTEETPESAEGEAGEPDDI